MRRSASEIIRNLENRVAHLERQPIGQTMEENYRDSDENVLFVANSLNNLLKKKRLHTDLVAETGQGVSILIDNSLGDAMEKLQGIRPGVKWFGDDKLYHLGLMWLVSENRDGDIYLTWDESRRRVALLERQASSLGDLSGDQVCEIVAKELSDLYHTTVKPRQVEKAMGSFLTEYEFALRTLSDAEFEDVEIKVYDGRRVGLKGEMELREGATNDFHSYGHEEVSLIFVFNVDLNRVDVRSTRLM